MKLGPLLVTLLVVIFLIVLSLVGLITSLRPPRITSRITPADLGLAYEEIAFTTGDGLRLAGWFIPGREEAATVILLHGYPADKGDILPALSFLSPRYNLLLFDFRSLGSSAGRISTAGARETEDLLAAVRFCQRRGIEEVGVWGFSMGAAVALMAAGEAPQITAVVAESSYARLDLMARELYRIPGLRYPLAYLTGLWSRIFLGINLERISPAEQARELDRPILVIHSRNDQMIPFEQALILQRSLEHNPQAEFWFEDNLVHGQLGPEYRLRIEAFFQKHLPEGAPSLGT